MYVQESTITFRCAANGCPNRVSVEFKTLPEVVEEDCSWILPAGWREEEVTVDDRNVFYICCPRHTIQMAPEFVDNPVAAPAVEAE